MRHIVWFSFGYVLAFATLVGGAFAVAKQEEPDDVIEKTKEYILKLDASDDVKSQKIDFSDYNIPAPEECNEPNIACHETAKIQITTTKQWKIYRTKTIDSPDLTSHDFAKKYPNLNENAESIDNTSPPEQKWILQRMLYERGLLPVFPTGNVGYETEKAIIKFQHIKGINEWDKRKGIVEIGPQTVKALNDLKERMKDPQYLEKRPLPVVKLNDLDDYHRLRYGDILRRQVRAERIESPDTSDEVEIVKPRYLKTQ